jgi:protocatechuate 3,4-dioxygenase beta subunit
MSEHDHDGGLARDLPLLTRRNLVAGLGLAGLAGTAAWLLGGSAGQAEANLTGTAADGTVCVKDPAETNGPFPADGTNAKDGQTVNALTQSGVVRDDLRPSFGGLEGVAEGVPLVLTIALVDVGNACQPLTGHAIYLWHADAEGHYSLYDLPDRNYLRGVVVTDAEGRATVTTVVPGCYDGRWPHIHFEVFSGLEAAVSGKAALLTSQFAFPETEVAAVYAADVRYPASKDNLTRISLASDNVFGDNTAEQIAVQTVAMTGDVTAGYAGQVTVGIA